MPGKWNTDHGISERDPVGSVPLTTVDQDTEQINEWSKSKDLIESLRVHDANAKDPWLVTRLGAMGWDAQQRWRGEGRKGGEGGRWRR